MIFYLIYLLLLTSCVVILNKYLVDKKFLRPLFINSPDDYDEAAKEIRKLLLNTDLEVPFIYLWPVNMAKCGFAAEEASKKIMRELNNK